MAEAQPPSGDDTLPLDDVERRRGRKYIYTPQIGSEILVALQVHTPRDHAAIYAGVHPSTLERWIKKGKELGEGPLKEFADAVESTEANAAAQVKAKLNRTIRENPKKHWRYAGERLARKFPDRFGKNAHAKLELKQLEIKIKIKLLRIRQLRGELPMDEAVEVKNAEHEHEPSGAGRKTVYTPELGKSFVDHIRNDHYFETTCLLLHVGASTVRGWLKDGEENPDGPYGDFYWRYQKALSDSMINDLCIIREAAKTDIAAMAWLDERVHGRHDPVMEQKLELAKLELEELELELKQMEAAVERQPEPIEFVEIPLTNPPESRRRRWSPAGSKSVPTYGVDMSMTKPPTTS